MVQLINHERAVAKKKGIKLLNPTRGVCVRKSVKLHLVVNCTNLVSNIWNHLEPHDRNTEWQSEQQQSRMTEKQGIL